MTVKELTYVLSTLKDELQDKEVVVLAKNGLEVKPNIRFNLKDPMKVHDKSKDNVESVIIDWRD